MGTISVLKKHYKELKDCKPNVMAKNRATLQDRKKIKTFGKKGKIFDLKNDLVRF